MKEVGADYDAPEYPTPNQQPREPRKIAIVGTAGSRADAPYGDDSWRIWGCSNIPEEYPRWDTWFELHHLDWLAKRGDRAEYLHWLTQDHGDRAIMLVEDHPQVPNGVKYPLEVIKQQFPRAYFNNTISYLIALAIYYQADVIGIWGVDMALDSEYGHQRPSCEYWVGIAEGLGIKVHIPDDSDLLKVRRLYGFEREGEFERRMREKVRTFKRRKQALEQQIERAKQEKWALEGALDAAEWDERTWVT